MKTANGKPIGEVPREKDPYWWMHPAYRGQQALDMDTLEAMPAGGYRWVRYADPGTAEPHAATDSAQPQGPFAEFAQLLYKANGFRPGPVKGWFVVVCVEPEARWAVGQLRADAKTPVQIFDDLVFDSEVAARTHAEQLRSG